MKVLFILDLFTPHKGGVETLFENIISRLIKREVFSTVLTSKFDKSLPDYEKINENLEIYRVGHNRYDFMFYSVFLGIKLAKKSDLIHSTTYNSAIPSSIISFFSGKKVILTVHEIFGKLWYRFMGWKGFFFKVFEDLVFKFNYDKLVCVSNYTKNNLRVAYGIDDKKLTTIYNGIDYNFWNKSNFSQEKINKIKNDLGINDNFVGLFYGRPGISKGLEFYIKAIQGIVNSIPEFKAILIVPDSKNNPSKPIKDLIIELEIEKNIIFIDGIDNSFIPYYILASNFVIIPSFVEGFGFAVAETCALEKNIITSDVSAIPEVVSGKVNFITPGDVDSIVGAIIKSYNNEYKQIPDKKFYWDDNIEKTLNVYNEILGK